MPPATCPVRPGGINPPAQVLALPSRGVLPRSQAPLENALSRSSASRHHGRHDAQSLSVLRIRISLLPYLHNRRLARGLHPPRSRRDRSRFLALSAAESVLGNLWLRDP